MKYRVSEGLSQALLHSHPRAERMRLAPLSMKSAFPMSDKKLSFADVILFAGVCVQDPQ